MANPVIRLQAARAPPIRAGLQTGFAPWRQAQVAQLVEHAIENRSVAGSIPALGTIALSRS